MRLMDNQKSPDSDLTVPNEPRHDKTNRLSVRPAMTQISLGIRPVWSESSLCAQWVDKIPRFLHADSEDSDQTGRMPRLIWVFDGHTTILLALSCCGWNENLQNDLFNNVSNKPALLDSVIRIFTVHTKKHQQPQVNQWRLIRMHRLSWVVAGCTGHFVGFAVHQLKLQILTPVGT